MLKKLIKYDLIWINKFMLIFYIITLIICTLTRIMDNYTQSFIGNIIYLILRGCAISCFVSILINCSIRIWARFNNSIYKDESYLTHTLPVKKDTLYNSKVLSMTISTLIAITVIIFSILLVFLNKDLINIIKEIFKNKDMTYIYISILIIAVLEIIYMISCGIIGLLIGNRNNNNKILKTIIIGIVLYFSIQLILLGIIYLVGLFNTSINDLFHSNIIIGNNISSVKSLVNLSGAIYIVFLTIMYFVGKHIFKKGVNVE